MSRDTTQNTPTQPKDKKSRIIEMIIVAVILILVAVLAVMSQRSCTITLTTPNDLNATYLWCEVYNDTTIATCTDAGYVSQYEYALKYTTTGKQGESVVVFACVDAETGDEVTDRVAYRITATTFGFLSATPVDIPKDLEDVTLPDFGLFETDTEALPDEPREEV